MGLQQAVQNQCLEEDKGSPKMQQNTGPLAFSLRCLYRVGSRFLSFEGKALALQKAVSFGLRQSAPFLLVGLGDVARGSCPSHLPLAQTACCVDGGREPRVSRGG